MKALTAVPMQPFPADLEALFQQHHALVYRTAWRLTGSSSDAEDILQTVFLRLLQRDASSEPVNHIGSYLHRAAVNASLDLLRARRSVGSVPLDDLEPVLAEAPHRGPERLRTAAEIRDWLRTALSRLNPRIAEMFALRFFDGKDNPEIARLMGTTTGTVAVTLSRTRDRLQKEFRAELGDVV
jgi:RNA polymerase sigma-70 factor (ECF subfamily)